MGLKSALQAAKDKLRTFQKKVSDYEKREAAKLKAMRTRGVDQLQLDAEQYACEKVAGMVRNELMRNYWASGLKEHTGNLLKAVAGANVWMSNKGKLYYAFKAGMTNAYSTGRGNGAPTKKKKGTLVYEYGQALISGAVRQPLHTRRTVSSTPTTLGGRQVVTYKKTGLLGAKAKRTIKKRWLGQPVSLRAMKAAIRGEKREALYDTGYRKETKTQITNGKITVVKPRPFFQLSEDQKKKIVDAFVAATREYLAKHKE